MEEKEKMRLGMWYDANNDQTLIDERIQAQDLCFALNQLKPSLIEERNKILNQLLGTQPENLTLLSPFTCDYGINIDFGKDVFVNVNCYFMDGGKITIGDHVFIGPSCGLYTANHPLDVQQRNHGLEQALPITIEKNVWLGANVVVLSGVTIGEGSVIAAGSVVTRDVPPYSLAGGVPCRVMKQLKEAEK